MTILIAIHPIPEQQEDKTKFIHSDQQTERVELTDLTDEPAD